MVSGTEETVYRIDAEEWAAHRTDPEAAEDPEGAEIVPVATRLVAGLPLWAVDELSEAVGACVPSSACGHATTNDAVAPENYRFAND